MKIAETTTSDARSAALAAFSAGLVPSKTSLETPFGKFLAIDFTNGGMLDKQARFISLAKPECTLRRIARLKRAVWASGHLHGISHGAKRPSKAWFVTLTYAKADEWASDHISFAIHQFRKWCARNKFPCRYTWVAEIQPKRLARTGKAVVHYHLLAWLPEGVSMPQWDRPGTNKRPTWWHHGMTNTEQARSGVGYLMKYLSKLGEFHVFPKGLRLYGIGGLDESGRSVRTWYNLPEWAKRSFGVGELRRIAGSLVVRATGEILAPCYSVSFMLGGLVVRQLRDIPDAFHSGAYSSLRPA